jgi:hypothetical protein
MMKITAIRRQNASFCAKYFRQTIKVAVKMAKKIGFHRQNRISG